MHRGTIIGIASMTMPLTTVSMMIGVEEYTPRLDEPMERLLPELAGRRVRNSRSHRDHPPPVVLIRPVQRIPLDEQKGAGRKMEMKLELVPVPVFDVDRAKAFYVEKVGFHADHDVQPGNGMRVVQLTPPGSACSILIGTGMGEMTDRQPGSVKGLHLVVADIHTARAALAGRGVTVSDVDDLGGIKYVHFSDPDGNTWLLQEIPTTVSRNTLP